MTVSISILCELKKINSQWMSFSATRILTEKVGFVKVTIRTSCVLALTKFRYHENLTQ